MSLNISLKRKKKLLLIAIIFLFCFITTGYFYVMYKSVINANIKFVGRSDTWDVKFTSKNTNITTKKQVGKARNYRDPIFSNYEVTFFTEFEDAGDSITYDVDIKNGGSLNAKVSDIIFYSDILDQVDCEYENISVGDELKPMETTFVRIKLTYNPKEDAELVEYGKVSIKINWVQAK